MGKGNDPNCAAGQPLGAPDAGLPDAWGPDGLDAERFLAGCETLDAGPIAYADLPMSGDEDLERQLDGQYGAPPDSYTFARRRCSLGWWKRHMASDDASTFRRVLADGPAFYERLEHEWRDDYADELAEVGGNPHALEDLDDLDYPDGRRRAGIVREHMRRLQAGERVEPLVCDLHGFSGGIHLMDGYHRLAAIGLTDQAHVEFFELLPE